ncbi:GAP family protein [Oceanitalea stevensii]|uniref:GAP family protein n=1 Tax=Oceanitalea stevensii TaxID=2763072 RepID=A0ABR8Z614_9MICO|nr:GAP family protein [Oceanitalea stevensii]MBD8063738.1 GAP family protein [Oceanitalea stevensii]
MTTATAATLAVLALVDSTSFGTLLIPIWFLLTPGRVRVGRILVFLGTVAGFYLLLGIALVAGLGAVLGDLDTVLENPLVARLQLVLGTAMLVGSFFVGRKRPGEPARPGRLLRWRERAMGTETDTGVGGLVTLALAAALLEVATMLPYLAATGIIGSSSLAAPARLGVLAAYCVVMVLPALLLLGGRLAAARLVQPLLERVAAWMERTGGETTAWIVGIVGFLVARDALGRIPELLSFLDAM